MRTLLFLLFLAMTTVVFAQEVPYTIVSKKLIKDQIDLDEKKSKDNPNVEVEELFFKIHPENASNVSKLENVTLDGRFHTFRIRYNNSDYSWLEVYDAKTGNLNKLYENGKGYMIESLIDPKGNFVIFTIRDTLRVVNLQTMELTYELDNLNNIHVKLSPNGNHVLIDYIDYTNRWAVLLVSTANWQLLTKINFSEYGLGFLENGKKFYIHSIWREVTSYKTYDHYKFSTVWDIEKIEQMAANNTLQTEYGSDEISYIDKFTDVSREFSISPQRNYVMAGNSLYKSDGTFIRQLPTPEKLGNSVYWQFSNDDKYLKTFETKWHVSSSSMSNEIEKTTECTLPDFKTVEGKFIGEYEAGTDYNLQEIAKTNPEMNKIINSGPTAYTPYNLWGGVRYSPTMQKVCGIKDEGKKSYKCSIGYFTGSKDKFKSIETFDYSDDNIQFFFNNSNDKVLVRIDHKKKETAEVQLWDLACEKMIKQIKNLKYYKYFIYDVGSFESKFFVTDDLSKIFSHANSDQESGDTISVLDINSEKENKFSLQSPTICMGGINSMTFKDGNVWIVTKNSSASSLAKYDATTFRKITSYQLPNALEQLKDNTDKKEIRDKMLSAKEEAERVLQSNKFDAKAYKAKIKQERKEVNSLLNQAVYEAASKNPVYETCEYCSGRGTISNSSIKYTREVSGSWGYSSSYSNVTTYSTTTQKCTNCNGTGRAICYRPSCYNINGSEIYNKMKKK